MIVHQSLLGVSTGLSTPASSGPWIYQAAVNSYTSGYGAPGDGDSIVYWQTTDGDNEMTAPAGYEPVMEEIDGDLRDESSISFDSTLYHKMAKDTLGGFASSSGAIFIAYQHRNIGHVPQILFSGFGYGTKYSEDYIRLAAMGDGTRPSIYSRLASGATNKVDFGSTGAYVLNDPYVLSFISNGSAWAVHLDGVDLTPTVDSGSNAGDWFGDLTEASGLRFAFNGYSDSAEWVGCEANIAEVRIYDTTLSAGDITTIENSLMDTYLPV